MRHVCVGCGEESTCSSDEPHRAEVVCAPCASEKGVDVGHDRALEQYRAIVAREELGETLEKLRRSLDFPNDAARILQRAREYARWLQEARCVSAGLMCAPCDTCGTCCDCGEVPRPRSPLVCSIEGCEEPALDQPPPGKAATYTSVCRAHDPGR